MRYLEHRLFSTPRKEGELCYLFDSCTSKTASVWVLQFINCFEKHFRLYPLNSELSDSVILTNMSITSSINRKFPMILWTRIRIIYNQFCYPKGFLSSSSYTLPLCKLGVHFLWMSQSQSDTLGWIIFIHHLRSTVVIDLA